MRMQVIAALAIIVLLAFTVWWEASLWSECRATNSFWYCVRVLNK